MAAEHVIDIVVETKDNVSPGLDRANKKLRGFEQSVEKTQARLKNFAKADYEVVLRAIDRITPAGSRARETLRSITGRTYNATIGAIDRTAIKVREAQARLTALTGKAWMVTIAAKNTISEKASGAVNGAMQSVTGFSGQMIAGAGIGYGIYDTVKTYKDFQQQMSAVAAISGASGAELDALTAKAKEMGAVTSFSATESAKAFEYMGMAGWKSEDMISGIAGIMNLAAASGEELGRVSDIVTDALTAFGLKASDSAHFADVLAQAATNSNTNVGMMGYTFKYAAPIAGALGYSIEDVGVAIGLMANAGIKGEQAGTSLRKIFSSIASPADQAAQILEDWGISATDASGNVKPLLGTMKELRAQFKLLTKTEQLDRAYSLVGEEAKSGFLAMMNASDADFDKLVESLNNAEGAAQKMADIRLDNLAGDMEQLGGAWETFQLSIMEGKGADGLRDFVQGVSKDLERLNKYLEDGFDITDVGRLALDILTQLKNKFLELDGVGSVLAGGVLAAGLYKIVRLAEKAGKFIKEASAGNVTGKATEVLGETAASVKSMIVHAQSVVVNGSGAGAGGAGKAPTNSKGSKSPSTEIPVNPKGSRLPTAEVPTNPKGSKLPSADIPTTPKGGAVPKTSSRLGGGAKILGRGAAIAGLALGAYSIYQENQQAIAEAQAASDGSEESIAHIKEIERENTNRMGASVGSTGGMLAGGFAGAKAGAVIGGGIGALFGGVGAAPGAAIGGFLGGIGGAVAGSELGESIGGQFAEISDTVSGVWSSIKSGASETWSGVKAGASETWDWIGNSASQAAQYAGKQWSALENWIGDSASQAAQYVGDRWNGLKDCVVDALSPVRVAVEDVINVIVGLGAVVWSMIKPYWDEGAAFIASVMQGIVDVVSAAWQWIKDSATAVWREITEQVSAAWESVCALLASAGEWFLSAVWQPISDFASDTWEAIKEIVITAWESVCATWAEASAWFLSAVWQPITDGVSYVWAFTVGAFSDAWDSICAVWGIASAWFDSTVWQPTSTAVDTVRAAISDAFRSAYDFVTGLFGGIAGWFEENVIGPIRNKFDELRSIGSGITGLAGSGGGSEAPHAAGGIFHAPHRGIVAENGPEAVIPLNDRTRGIRILECAATMMGVDVDGIERENANPKGTPLGSTGSFAGAKTGEVISAFFVGNEAPYATGGRFFALHRGIVAENESKAIAPMIDHTPELGIFERVATMMGLDFGDGMDNPFTGDDTDNTIPLTVPTALVDAPQSVSIELGGISIPITISGGSTDAQSVVQAIRENLEDIADDIGGQLADKVASIFGNQPVMNAR